MSIENSINEKESDACNSINEKDFENCSYEDDISEDIPDEILNRFIESLNDSLKKFGSSCVVDDRLRNMFIDDLKIKYRETALKFKNKGWRFLEHINVLGEPDNSNAARDFYREKFRFFSEDESKYSGDTIVSFKTMAGCMIRGSKGYHNMIKESDSMPSTHEGRLAYILKFDDINDDMKIKFIELRYLTHTCANFMPLPKGNLNLSKGNSATYHDFPDSFFGEFKNYVTMFMDKCTAKKWWEKFIEENYLQSLFENNEFKNSEFESDESSELSTASFEEVEKNNLYDIPKTSDLDIADMNEKYRFFRKIEPAPYLNGLPMPYYSLYNTSSKKLKVKYDKYMDEDGSINSDGVKNILSRINMFLDNSIEFILERNFYLQNESKNTYDVTDDGADD